MKQIITLLTVTGAITLLSACNGGGLLRSKKITLHKRTTAIPANTEIGENIYYFRELTPMQTTEHITVSTAKTKSGKFTALTLFSEDLEIIQVEIRDYPFTHGRGVKRTSFLNQFSGWDGRSDIDSVTRATISCKALTKAVIKSKTALQNHLSEKAAQQVRE